jgi:hypothetical protein
MLVHEQNGVSPTTAEHAAPGYVAPSQPATLLILRERPDVVAARIARKRRVREALFAVHGTLKREFLASLLGHASTRHVVKCLSDAHRDELSELHCLKLGIAGVSDRRAA